MESNTDQNSPLCPLFIVDNICTGPRDSLFSIFYVHFHHCNPIISYYG
jgi:hypothetical protein